MPGSIDGSICNNTFEQKTISNLLKYLLESEKIFCCSKSFWIVFEIIFCKFYIGFCCIKACVRDIFIQFFIKLL